MTTSTCSARLATVVLDVRGLPYATEKNVVETVLGRRPGVHHVEANPVSQTATVTFEPSVTSVRELARWILRRLQLPTAEDRSVGKGSATGELRAQKAL